MNVAYIYTENGSILIRWDYKTSREMMGGKSSAAVEYISQLDRLLLSKRQVTGIEYKFFPFPMMNRESSKRN